MAVNLCALLCILMLLACFTQPKPHDDLPLRSMEIRDPNIDAVWYKGRGIRPLGRFGRRMAQKGEGSYFGRHRFCYPEVLAKLSEFI
uniref:Prolactin releasing hormone n=1 Tax=Sinocyclocheilus rhinocerous TaxID=307959 RepID=A0A673KZK6_9TELE